MDVEQPSQTCCGQHPSRDATLFPGRPLPALLPRSIKGKPIFQSLGRNSAVILDSCLLFTHQGSKMSASPISSTVEISPDSEGSSLPALEQPNPSQSHLSPGPSQQLLRWSPCFCPSPRNDSPGAAKISFENISHSFP